MPTFWKRLRRVTAWSATAIYVFVAIAIAYLQVVPGSWYVSIDLRVPSYDIGDTPNVIYTRTVARTLIVSWGAETNLVLTDGRGKRICTTGGDQNIMEAGTKTLTKPLVDFMRKPECVPKVSGTYRIRMCVNWPVWIFRKHYCTQSNIWAVRAQS